MFHKLPTILVLLSFATTAYTSCHTCQSNLAMCHDERRFTMCSAEGISSNEMFECPSGYICTGEDEICIQTNGENSLQPTCDVSCDMCNSEGNLFACVGETIFAYCFGADVPDYETTGSCPNGYVCNLNSPQVCTPAADDYPSCYKGSSSGPSTLAPSTSESTVTTEWSLSTESSSTVTSTSVSTASTQTSTGTESSVSTPAPSPTEPSSTTTQKPKDASTFCEDQQKTGYYRAEGDQTCQEYFYCYLLSGQYLGVKYTCPTSTFFDSETEKCQSKRPDDC